MIKVINATQNPIQLMGKVAGCCYGSKDEPQANYKRGVKCLKDGHGRVLEYPDVVISIDGYSARMVRELYTAMVGVSKLQSSTRYITYDNMDYYTPESLQGNQEYVDAMEAIRTSYKALVDSGIAKEDVANILPLGMISKTVIKINYRALLHMAEIRMCERAYIEFRDFMQELIQVLSTIDEEWAELMTYMKPKCKICTEKESCPRLKKGVDSTR